MDRRLSDYVTFVSGVNPTRANKQIDDVIVYYEQSDFNNDFLNNQKNYQIVYTAQQRVYLQNRIAN